MNIKIQIKLLCVSFVFFIPTLVNAEISWYGQINRGMLWVDDGHNKNTFFVDSSFDNSKVGVKGDTNLDGFDGSTKIGGQIELGVISASSNAPGDKAVSQLNRSGSNNFMDINIVDTWIEGAAGKLSLGRGDMASRSTGTVTLSGAELISYAGVSDMAGGMYFHPRGEARGVQIDDPKVGADGGIFDSISGFGAKDRVRYDFPKFGSFILSTSVGNDATKDTNNVVTKNKYCADVALTYEESVGNFKLKGAAAMAKSSKASDAHNSKLYNGSFAILHVNTGLNAAVSLGKQFPATDATATGEPTLKKRNFYYIQLGKQAELITYGKTNFVIDYFKASNNALDSDKAKAYSAGLVQKIDKINTELYFGVRQYKYEKPTAAGYNHIVAALLGFKINLKGKLL